ncbi:chemotaxis signal transduction protein [Beggiatoa alba B18LD]|uniref:Chemotaxis signal transduction protein n=1 Tax=Beggiatoa alba B18LD TaxID=395493 RepID=I3CJG1_9GAMM|nr:chemotaxis protein CheW [Beggiatoa alba]EIJ43754.1 chemotaxis signal transduction protein [Beggiatoa alba B18LD]
MPNTMAQTPFQWLQELERRAKQKARGIPRQEKVQQIWRGIAFRVGNTPLVTPLNEIREILPYPTYLAKVPGAKAWVKGLANIRGLLLPIVDLQACLDGKATPIESRTRLVIINQAGISAGLVVDEVLGIKHFPEEAKDTDTPCKDAWLTPFAKGMFIEEDSIWTIFDMHALAESEVFLRASL